MGITNESFDDVFHRIRIKLFPNYLPNTEGAFIARTENEAFLNIEQICTIMKNRGGFAGKFSDLLDNIRHFFREVSYQLCDGFAVNMDFFSIHPNIGGTFSSEKDARDNKKNPVGFRYRTRAPLRELARRIDFDITGVADGNAYIHEFIDYEEDSINGVFVPNNMFCINGNKIKLAGDDPKVGVYFVPVDDPSKAVKVKRIAENNPSKITGISPDTEHERNRIEVRTQFTGSASNFLKKARVITSDFIIEAS